MVRETIVPDSLDDAAASSRREDGSTRRRLLEIAEEVFAERGFERTSLRDLTRRAGANLASVSYHFGSKTGLLEALLGRKIAAVNDQRIDLLEAAKQTAGGAPVPVRGIVRALIGPLMARGEQFNNPCMVMMSRMLMEQPEFAEKIFEKHFAKVHRAFREEFNRTLPALSHDDITWRLHFTVALMLGAINQRHRIKYLSSGALDAEDWATTERHLIEFITAAWLAPASVESEAS